MWIELSGYFPALCRFEPPTSREVLDIIVNLNSATAGHAEIKAKLLKEVVSIRFSQSL